MNAMQPEIQWFIAREGKQHGPISDVEMKKLVELGHLRQTDLVWRHGFPDWRPSTVVFPMQAPMPPAPQPASELHQPQHVEPVASEAHAATSQSRVDTAPHGDWQPTAAQFGTKQPDRHQQHAFDLAPAPRTAARRLIIPVLLLGFLGAAAIAAYEYKDELFALTQTKTGSTGATSEPMNAGTAASETPVAPPVAADTSKMEALPGLEGPSLVLDEQLRSLRHWSIIRREFPDWYVERVNEAAKLTTENAKENEIGRHLAGEIVKLRRQSMNQALAAPIGNLKAMAKAFLDNLVALEKIGPQVCYAFIARGENTPMVADMLHAPDLGGPVKEQVAAIFEAVGAGRKQPVKHVAADKTDYDLLANQLSKSGWSRAQLQLFANPSALASSTPDKVCSMVQDWFRAHLALEDSQVQERLLFETLKPVVGG